MVFMYSAELLSLAILMLMMSDSHGGVQVDEVKHEGEGEFRGCSFDALYQFGDSIADTGNLIRENVAISAVIGHLPYGETYFHKATGRCSDGLLIIDFVAKAFNLPLLNPYLDKTATFTQGVNFAVAGATALDLSFFARKFVLPILTKSSLSVQLDWFKNYLRSLCTTREECKRKLEKALFFVGEIGENDYNSPFLEGRTIEEVQTYVPQVVDRIIHTVKEVIAIGATQVVVPGIFPLGCFPSYLTLFQTNDSTSYDEYHCLKAFNSLVMFHNSLLQNALDELRHEYTDVGILYADYYNPFQKLLINAQSLGLEKEYVLKACCGTGGDYNFNFAKFCGLPGISACANPEQLVHWDGIHLTQKAYEYIAGSLIDVLQSKKC